MTKTTKTYLQEMCDGLEPIEDKMTIKKIDLQEIKFGFDVQGDWSHPEADVKSAYDAMMKAQEHSPLLHWGEGDSIESVITYPMWQIVKVESSLVLYGDLIFDLWGDVEFWGDDNLFLVDAMDDVQEIIIEKLAEKLIYDNLTLIVNGYEIKYNPHWMEFQASHDDIGAIVHHNPYLGAVVDDCKKG